MKSCLSAAIEKRICRAAQNKIDYHPSESVLGVRAALANTARTSGMADGEAETMIFASNKRKHSDTPDFAPTQITMDANTVDLTEDDASMLPIIPAKRLRTAGEAPPTPMRSSTIRYQNLLICEAHRTPSSDQTSQSSGISIPSRTGGASSRHGRGNSSTATSANGASSPAQTASGKVELLELPELADRYVARISTMEGVEYTNPQTFCTDPFFWKRWSAQQYSSFADNLRAQFDPLPFVREWDIPVDEVQHVFSTLVCNPLYYASEATQRGEEGMMAIAKLSNHGSYRRWGRPGDGEAKAYALLAGVERDVVVLTLEDGSKRKLKLAQLAGPDVKYLQDRLLEKDKEIFWEGQDRSRTMMMQELRKSYGTHTRQWGRQDSRRFGKIKEVKQGVVVVTSSAGVVEVRVSDLVEEDVSCLRAWLSVKEQELLWPRKEVKK